MRAKAGGGAAQPQFALADPKMLLHSAAESGKKNRGKGGGILASEPLPPG